MRGRSLYTFIIIFTVVGTTRDLSHNLHEPTNNNKIASLAQACHSLPTLTAFPTADDPEVEVLSKLISRSSSELIIKLLLFPLRTSSCSLLPGNEASSLQDLVSIVCCQIARRNPFTCSSFLQNYIHGHIESICSKARKTSLQEIQQCK